MTLSSIFCLKRRPRFTIHESRIRGNFFQEGVRRLREKKAAGGGKGKPVKIKKPKVRKSHPAHKKLHVSTHPMLAEKKHSKKWDDCVQKVKKRGGGYDPYAVCTNSLGTGASYESFFKAAAKTFSKMKCNCEACDTSTATANLVKGKESTTNVVTDLKIQSTKFREAALKINPDATTFRVVLIEEGLGNFGDAFYYTADALESAVELFNGLKIYADHPTAEEEEIRPERSTRDILGHYENVEVEEGDGGQSWLCADVNILPSSDCDWARARMIRAIENASKFPDRNFIGLSINASGDAEPTPIEDVMDSAPAGAQAKLQDAIEKGIDTVKVVHKINRATSCDLVTEAGAGGKILNIIEGEDDGD